MRALWKGSISFGLINVPIALYPATQREELKFRLLRSSDLSPVNYKRVAEVDGKEVPWEQIVKGYEYEKGKFVVLKEDDFKRVDVEATQTVDILDFVPMREINPIYFSKPYYMEPMKGGAKPYGLLRDVLRNTDKVGLAKVVIRSREHLAAVKPNGNALMLELMHFGEELSEPGDLKLPEKVDFRKGEIDMATELIARMTSKWDPAKYKDEYKDAVMKLIEEKIEKGDQAPAKGKVKPRKATNVVDLMDVLRKSISEVEAGHGKRSKSKTARKAA